MTRWFLAIEGVIGAGKTTLARMLAPALGAYLVLERFEENPFLPHFYRDRARYAFPTQIFFLLSRYRQHQELAARLEHEPVVSDYMFAKDRLFAHLNLDGDELALYEQLHKALAEKTPQPALVLYLRADTDTLMARIAMRDRPYERGMDRAYIERLRLAYEAFFSTYEGPFLVIDATRPFVQDEDVFQEILREVRGALGLGPAQQPLPVFTRTALPSSAATEETLARAFADLTRTIGFLREALFTEPRDPQRVADALQICHQQLVAIAQAAGIS
ncbi:deoxynucleoside kinase [Thermoflexus sp.]|uniref:deoxynucleoside kinase n=1 Tax=Thermoflexus sp. TaxID=1969742 RepID=UPI0025E4EA60|nr:deoxynucleoside kinase [Thermoflexus sp.]MDW8180155.1 deoxynucleoside kinase [Anaerolineae bacterium]MCS6964508.1 deoxynucleoside kinase [Thermoflexus sp.]MCS7350704.1 deoxynucleoside kinase [Thermoflexus sp.]MCX7690603.1 deoxynucleoside kinase [Thermoflexus sp.]MDW8184517.1 deoxynucleoside kinase [Anaerolineae bacterium]